MSLTCQQCEQLLAEYLYEELPEDQMSLIQRHLESCVSCREELESYRRVLQAVDVATRTRPRGMPTAGLLQRIHQELDSNPIYHRPRRVIKIPLWWVAVAATILASILAIYALNTFYGHRPDAQYPPVHEATSVFGDVTGRMLDSRRNGADEPAQARESSGLLRGEKLHPAIIPASTPSSW